ncbi:MAG: c-type cytochrome [Acidocella sp.]|nr:c-type cytochrome [Acidocella sp.]
MKLKAWMAVVAAIMVIAPAFAEPPDGKQIFLHGNGAGAMPCAACHGVDARGNTSIGAPKLAGLPVGVIESALAQFAHGGGGNASMQYIAQALNPAETDAVASYLANLK